MIIRAPFCPTSARQQALTQKGFTMVELMVSILLGSLVILGASSLFMTSHRTFQLQQSTADVQEGGRFAIEHIARSVRHAGLDAVQLAIGAAPMCSASVDIGSAQSVPLCADGLNGAAGANDQLIVRYSPALVGGLDCEGSAVAAGVMAVNTYFVAAGGDGRNALLCDGNDAGTAGAELVSGIDSFQVLYGVDKQLNGEPLPSQFKRRDQLAAGDTVVAVKLGLLARSENRVQGAVRNSGFTVLDVAVPKADDSFMRRQFAVTVPLRNLDAGAF